MGKSFILLLICCLCIYSHNTKAEGFSKQATFVLINAQEREAELIYDVNVPILVFGLHIGKDGKVSLGLLEEYEAKGDRELQLLENYGMMLSHIKWKGKNAVFDFNRYGDKDWIRHYNVTSMAIAKNNDSDDVFFAGDCWGDGEYPFVTFLAPNPKSKKAVFLRDNIIIDSKPMYYTWKGLGRPPFWIVYDKKTSCLANRIYIPVREKKNTIIETRYVRKLVPLTLGYPPALTDMLSSSVYKDMEHCCCAMIRNDNNKRLIACLNPDKNELHFYSFDFEKKEWNAKTFSDMRPPAFLNYDSWNDVFKYGKWQLDTLCFSDASFSEVGSWLIKYEKKNINGRHEVNAIFYSLSNLKERFSWVMKDGFSGPLAIADGIMLFGKKDNEIWGADYDENGIGNCRFLVRSSCFRGGQWVLRVPDGSLGDPSKWQLPRLYPMPVPYEYKGGSIMTFYVSEPLKALLALARCNAVAYYVRRMR